MRDRSATMLTGPNTTPQQVLNSQLVVFLYTFWVRLDKLNDECSEVVLSLLRPSINVRLFVIYALPDAHSTQNLQEQCARVVDPLLYAIRREFAAIIATLHKLDFSKSNSASAGMMSGGGASVYMEELVAKLNFVKTEILDNYSSIDISRKWCVTSL